MKTAIILALLAVSATAEADKTVYDVHATTGAWTDLPSCGAAERMLGDKHVIVVDETSITINGFRWTTKFRDPWSAFISFHEGQLTYLEMSLDANDRSLIGRYTLYGVLDRTKDGYTRCADRVEIRGTRR